MTDQALVKTEHGIDSLEKMGKYIADSGLFGVKKQVEAVALMLIAQAEGRHPASAAMDYHIILGRPSLKSETMLARFQGAGGKVEWVELTDTKVVGKFSHPSGGTVTIDWDMDRAKRAGLGTKDNWKTYPRAMLRARVISEAIRTVYPAVLGGMYAPEEVMDFSPESPGNGHVPATQASPKKADPAKKDKSDPFAEMVKAKGVGEATSPLLDRFVEETAKKHDKTVAAVKKQAVQKPEQFWSGFAAWMKDQGNGEDEAPPIDRLDEDGASQELGDIQLDGV